MVPSAGADDNWKCTKSLSELVEFGKYTDVNKRGCHNDRLSCFPKIDPMSA